MNTRWANECVEWREISKEISKELEAASALVTAHDVSMEQRKRMAARGETPMTYQEVLDEAAALPPHEQRADANELTLEHVPRTNPELLPS